MSESRDHKDENVPNMGTIVPNMGTCSDSPPLGSALFGKTRLTLLALIFGNPEKRFYTRQIIEALGDASGAARRELKGLTDAGILLREREGRQVYYRANPDCPIYAELVSLVRKTVGLVDVLRDALEPLGDSITVAFVFGSMAKGTAGSRSDVDLMVIGTAMFGDVVDALARPQDILGREINPSVYSEVELRHRIRDGEHFLTSVVREPKLFVIGGPDELDRVAGAGLAGPASEQPA